MRKILALSAIMGTAAYIIAKYRIKPKTAHKTFAELYEDNECDLSRLFD